MRLFLTGSAGRLGSRVLLDLLSLGHSVVSVDLVDIPEVILAEISQEQKTRLQHYSFSLNDYDRLDAVFRADAESSHNEGGPLSGITDTSSAHNFQNQAARASFDGVIHLSAIPDPLSDDPRLVHNNNVVSTYNVLQTAVKYGVRRIVQASSVNAPGLSYTPEGRQVFDELPLTEDQPMRAMDPYALSKEINETQARCLVRIHPDLRIASLRLHMVRPQYSDAVPDSHGPSLFCWVSTESCVRACLLGITSEGWSGAEAFQIVAPEICWEAGISEALPGGEHAGAEEKNGAKVSSLVLLEKAFKGRYGKVDESYWAGRRRRNFFCTDKAEKMLGWKHDI